MSHLRNALLAGVAVVVLGGAAGLAQAQTPDGQDVHVMTVRTPDGALEQIRYTGNVPPHVVFVPVSQTIESPFAIMERIEAQMDQQMAQTMQAFAPMMAQPFGSAPITAAFGAMPAGSGVCMRSISVTYDGNGTQPRVVSRSSGDCGSSAQAPAAGVSAPSVAPEKTNRAVPTIQVKDEHPAGQPAYRALVIPATDWRG